MENENGAQTPEAAGDQTPSTNENDSLETLKAQKTHWRDQAIDPETGKKYKDLYTESLKKGDKTPAKKNESSSKKNSPDEGLQMQVQKLALKVAGITKESEIELAERIQKETGKDWDTLLESKYFKTELEELRSSEAIETATTDVKGNRGGGNGQSAKQTAEFWISKGTPPTPADVPDRKVRAGIIRQFLASQKSSKTFYND